MSRLIVVEFNDHNGAIEFGNIVGELVRCKECKHWQEYKGEHFCHNVYGLHDDTKADDFC